MKWTLRKLKGLPEQIKLQTQVEALQEENTKLWGLVAELTAEQKGKGKTSWPR